MSASLRFYLLILLVVGLARPCPAQTSPQAGASDALILVQAQGGTALIAVTFPQAIPHARLRDRLAGMAAAAGWQMASLEMKDEELETNPLFGPTKKLGKQTGATMLLTNAPQLRDGGFVLQPYINAFGDLNRFEILFLTAPFPAFQGLRDFRNEALHVQLIHEGSPYRYLVEVLDHNRPLPTLPLTQSRTEPDRSVKGNHAAAPTGLSAFGPVMILAGLAGLLVFAILLVRIRLRAASRTKLPNGTKGMSNRA